MFQVGKAKPKARMYSSFHRKQEIVEHQTYAEREIRLSNGSSFDQINSRIEERKS